MNDRRSKFEITSTNDYARWDEFNNSSLQGSVFTDTKYLLASKTNFQLFVVRLGEDIKAGICICVSKDGKDLILDDFMVYGGLIFANDQRQKRTSAVLERFTLTEQILDFLTQQFRCLEMALSPNLEDMRPFLWHNYGGQSKNKFSLNLRYTSELNIGEFSDCDDEISTNLFKNLERVRRRHIKAAQSQNVYVETGGDSYLLAEFYKSTMEMQGIDTDPIKLDRVISLHNKLSSLGIGQMFTVKTEHDETLYIISVGYNEQVGYALYAAGNPLSEVNYAGTLAYWEAGKWLAREKNIKIFDMEGINSPSRSWFKVGFGGEFKQYFEVSLGLL